jgi:hypothetical protein
VDELIKLVAQKAGINAAAAKTAVETVMAFVKTKLPAPLAAQLDALVAGQAANLAQGLGAVTPPKK